MSTLFQIVSSFEFLVLGSALAFVFVCASAPAGLKAASSWRRSR